MDCRDEDDFAGQVNGNGHDEGEALKRLEHPQIVHEILRWATSLRTKVSTISRAGVTGAKHIYRSHLLNVQSTIAMQSISNFSFPRKH